MLVSLMMGGRLWKIAGRTIDLSRRGMIMGVLNITPDSFSDGGDYFSTDKAVEHALEMAEEGAQIIDVGGESTRPGAEPVSAEEELRRVIPVIERLRGKIDPLSARRAADCGNQLGRPAPSVSLDPPRESVSLKELPAAGGSGDIHSTSLRFAQDKFFISIDTSKAEVASAAIDAGASIVNDVTGGRGDSQMLPLIGTRNAAFIIMHMQGTPRTMQIAPHYVDVVSEVADFFRQQFVRVLECGIDPMAIAFDPGIGFGKALAHNLELLGNLERLRVEGRPLVVGVSRKSFLGKLIASSSAVDRLVPTVAMTSLLRSRGAEVLRVHDVKENVAALRAAEAILAT